MQERLLQRLYRLMDSPLGAVLGGFCYGLWALYANRHAGWAHASLIGAAHWLMSASLTYGCVSLMRTLFRLPRDPRLGAVLAGSGSLLATYTLLISVHRAIGTPNILLTLTPGLVPTIGFALVFSSLLLREARQRSEAGQPVLRAQAEMMQAAGVRDARS